MAKLKNGLSNRILNFFLLEFSFIAYFQLNGVVLKEKINEAAAMYRIASGFIGAWKSSTNGAMVKVNQEIANMPAGTKNVPVAILA